MRWILLVVLWLWVPLFASAQTIFKCRGPKGQAMYQTAPCAGGPAEKSWSGSYREPTRDELWQRYRLDQRWQQRQNARVVRRSGFYAVPSGVPSRSSANAAACSAARSEYSRVQADFKLNRNIDLLRRLEADIYRYCEARP